MSTPIQVGGAAVDMSQRIAHSSTVAASPTDNTETIIATVTVPGNLQLNLGIYVIAVAEFTIGASGTAANLKIRRTNASGTTIHATGATTAAAGNLVNRAAAGIDLLATGVGAGTVYVATLTITAGAAASTVSAVSLLAWAI